jgi:selenocysteine lyase/cysteine desulfurase
VDLESFRESIAATRGQIYLNTGMTGPSPSPVISRIAEMMTQQATAGPGSPEGRAFTQAANAAAQQAAAALLNGDPDEIILTHGTTEGVHVVLHGYPWQEGDEFTRPEHAAVSRRWRFWPSARASSCARSGCLPSPQAAQI